MNKNLALFVFLLFFVSCIVYGQSGSGSSSGSSSSIDPNFVFIDDTFPLWARDLRRGEIVAFGSFPFTYFVSTFMFDWYRTLTHDGDSQYYPWPFNISGSSPRTTDEHVITIASAAAISVIVAVIDYFLFRHKRKVQAEQVPQYREPVIIRDSWPPSALNESGDTAPETPVEPENSPVTGAIVP
ncbi:hypothetical protein FACS1894151_10470 [Spirochaetia bacterium]|nr:hypothetical protein FACS1894151_10470 [Spirochaetia bacterium]